MEIRQLRDLISRLPASLPVTDEYELRSTRKVWYSSQKEHLLGWLEEYDGPGYYNRKNPGRDAKHLYNHLKCAPALLWLAEGLGEEAAALERAVAKVKIAGRNPSAQCGAFRREIPWTRIEVLADSYAMAHPLGLRKVKSWLKRDF